MPKICYIEKKFSAGSEKLIGQANQIITDFADQGFKLTLRQLYYQFVARDLIKNIPTEYKRMGSIINDARLAGLIDWKAIEDRTRNIKGNTHWDSPGEIVRSCADDYTIDMWKGQTYRPEVWIEKDALIGVIERVCTNLDVTFFSCHGYNSQSEMWAGAQRLKWYAAYQGQTPIIIHLGDHDPSGIDMSRDILDRLTLFMGGMKVNRIALNADQVEKYNPPPNPTKVTDSRAAGYIKKFGRKSWELDALEPAVMEKLIEKTVLKLRDDDAYEQCVAKQRQGQNRLQEVADDLEESEE